MVRIVVICLVSNPLPVSVDGDQWKRMRATFDLFHRSMASRVQRLPSLVTRHVHTYLKTNTVIDANAIIIVIVSAFTEWIFDKPVFDPIQHAFVLDAIASWRMAIAQKGTGNIQAKYQTVAWIQQLVRESKHFDLFGEQWMEPEYYSVIMQPFLVSPAINFVDLAVAVQTVYESDLEQATCTSSSGSDTESTMTKLTPRVLTSLIDRALHEYHPFPILERLIWKEIQGIPANTVVLMPMDTMLKGLTSEHSDVRSFAFGAGDRACPGQLIAKRVLVALLEETVGHPLFCPRSGHECSGRQNDDKDSIMQVMYQVVRMLTILLKLVWSPLNRVYTATMIGLVLMTVIVGYQGQVETGRVL